MENELISIIVPIHNVENYLRQCLESISEQTYKTLNALWLMMVLQIALNK